MFFMRIIDIKSVFAAAAVMSVADWAKDKDRRSKGALTREYPSGDPEPSKEDIEITERLTLIAVVAFACSPTFARTIVVQSQPVSPYADTEASRV